MTFNTQDDEIEYLISRLKHLTQQKYGIFGRTFKEDITEVERIDKALTLYDTIMPILYLRNVPIDAIWNDSIEDARIFLSLFL